MPPVRFLSAALAFSLVTVGGCSSASSNFNPSDGIATLDTRSPDVGEQKGEGDSVAVGAGDAAISENPVNEPGPFNVGYREAVVRYTPVPGKDERELDLHIWYPTQASEGEHPTYEKIFPDSISLVDAALAPLPAGDDYPLVIFSHGHRGFAGNAAFLMRHFASHGWVAAAPDHTSNTISDGADPREASIYYLRSLDMSAVLDYLEDAPTEDPLSDKVKTSEVVLVGHSFGVHTCWGSAGASFDMQQIASRCAESPQEDGCDDAGQGIFSGGVRDERVVAIVPMAGSIDSNFYGEGGHSTVNIPVFAMSGTEDPVGAEAQFERCVGMDIRWLEVVGGCHQTFGFGGCPTLEDEVGFNLVSAYALAFSRWVLLDDDAPDIQAFLDGSNSEPDKVLFHTH